MTVTGPAGLLELAPGATVVADGATWVVETLEPHAGRVLLRPAHENENKGKDGAAAGRGAVGR